MPKTKWIKKLARIACTLCGGRRRPLPLAPHPTKPEAMDQARWIGIVHGCPEGGVRIVWCDSLRSVEEFMESNPSPIPIDFVMKADRAAMISGLPSSRVVDALSGKWPKGGPDA